MNSIKTLNVVHIKKKKNLNIYKNGQELLFFMAMNVLIHLILTEILWCRIKGTERWSKSPNIPHLAMGEAVLNSGSLILKFSPIFLLQSLFLAELSNLKNGWIRLETSLRIPFNFKMLSYVGFIAKISGCVNCFKLLRQGRIWNNIIHNLKCYSDEKLQ